MPLPLTALLASTPPGPSPITAQAVVVQIVKAVIVMAFLLAGFRLLGKREMSQLTVYDLAMLFALSNAVQNAMTAGRGNLLLGLGLSGAIVVVAWALGRVLVRAPRLEARIIGSPTILVNHGVVLDRNLRRQRVGRDELEAAIRGIGLAGPDQVGLAVLEVDGSISIVPRH